VIVEVRRGERTVSLTAFDGEGGVHGARHVADAA
jgi:hypothetical protein